MITQQQQSSGDFGNSEAGHPAYTEAEIEELLLTLQPEALEFLLAVVTCLRGLSTDDRTALLTSLLALTAGDDELAEVTP